MDNCRDNWWNVENRQQISTVELANNSKRQLRFDQSRTEQNSFVLIGKSEVEVTNRPAKRLTICARGIAYSPVLY